MNEVEYPEPPACRTDEDASFTCTAKPRWVVTSTDRDGYDYTDHVCGRHLSGFLMTYLGHGQSVSVTADYGYGLSPVTVSRAEGE